MNLKSDLSVGEVAKRSGVPVSTLHFYEEKGLISGYRTAGNQRRYARTILRRVSIIKIAQQVGLSLSVIQDYLSQVDAQRELTAADWRRISSSWKEMINDRIDTLLQLRDQLDSCIGCGCLSLKDCPLRNPNDCAAKIGAGARFLIDKPKRKRKEKTAP